MGIPMLPNASATQPSFANAIVPFTTVDRTEGSLVFIDANVEDYQSLVAGVVPGAEVVILDPNRDGIAQISASIQNSSL